MSPGEAGGARGARRRDHPHARPRPRGTRPRATSAWRSRLQARSSRTRTSSTSTRTRRTRCAHEEGTGREILDQCGGKLDAVVMTAGTGGTITGVARAIKTALPELQDRRRRSRGLDPRGPRRDQDATRSRASATTSSPTCSIAGSSTSWIKSNDRDSFRVARQLIRQEGLLVGGSSGSAVWAAMQVCKDLGAGQARRRDPARLDPQLPDRSSSTTAGCASRASSRRTGRSARSATSMRALGRREVISLDLNDKLGRRDRALQGARHLADAGARPGQARRHPHRERSAPPAGDRAASTRHRRSPRSWSARSSTVSMHAGSGELPRIFERGEVAIVVDDHALR